MASIRKRGTTHQVRWRNGGRDGREVSESFSTYKAAVEFRGLVDAAGQRYPEGWIPGYGFVAPVGSSTSLEEWFRRVMASRSNISPSTRQLYESRFKFHVPHWLASRSLSDITREDAGKWMNELREARSTRTGRPLSPMFIKSVHDLISSVVKDAVTEGYLQRNPFRGLLKGVDMKVRDMVFLTPEEFEVLHAAMTEHYQAFIEFDFWTGLRFGEITVLQPRQFDLNARTLRVDQAWKSLPGGHGAGHAGPPKTRRGTRTIALSDRLCGLVEPRLNQPLVFANSHGDRIQQVSFRGRWRTAVENSGLEKKPRFHDLRHSHAAYLLSKNVPVLAVSRRLGHAGIQITADTYGHLLPEVDDGIRRLLE